MIEKYIPTIVKYDNLGGKTLKFLMEATWFPLPSSMRGREQRGMREKEWKKKKNNKNRKEQRGENMRG